MTIDFSPEDRKEYKQLEEKAQEFYSSFNRAKASKSWLKLSTRLIPLRIACAGGHVPLNSDAARNEVDDGDVDSDEEKDFRAEDSQSHEDKDESDSEEEKVKAKKTKKAVQLSEYAYKSKLERLIKELVAVREEDPTCEWPSHGSFVVATILSCFSI